MNNLFTKEPYGWPLMQDAFFDFVLWAVGQTDMHAQFKKASGHDLESLIPKNGLARMIDEATGRTKDIIGKFIDWLIVNHWGEVVAVNTVTE
jgi:hypothetical protein